MGFICLTWSSLAQIDSTVFNPPIVVSIPDSCGSNTYRFDLNNDSIYDYYLEVELFTTMENSPHKIESHRSKIYSYGINKVNAGPFYSGDQISSQLEYLDYSIFFGWIPEFGGFVGNWAIQKIEPENSAFIGLELEKDGSYYYGWIELKTDGRFIEILGYALQLNASLPINAGQY
jgi:hypothetical protein